MTDAIHTIAEAGVRAAITTLAAATGAGDHASEHAGSEAGDYPDVIRLSTSHNPLKLNQPSSFFQLVREECYIEFHQFELEV